MPHENASATANYSAQSMPIPSILVNGTPVNVTDQSPTARQLLQAAGYAPAGEYLFIRLPLHGATDSAGLDDPISLHPGSNQFFAFKEDGASFFSLNDVRFEWKEEITESELRLVGRIPDDHDIFLELKNKEDRKLENGETINLGKAGVEYFYTTKRQWELDVQGEPIYSESPTITVRKALETAGFDTTKPWIITLKVQGEPKQPVELDFVIDLTRPGIERLRVLKGQVTNGEAALRREFNLLPKDHAYLDAHKLRWETIIDNGRWLLLNGYPLPEGYNQEKCTMAVAIPDNYPAGQLDMFYCEPSLLHADGQPIPQTEVFQQIDSRSFQRWSRHATFPWQPDEDSIRTHLALVDESIVREVGL